MWQLYGHKSRVLVVFAGLQFFECLKAWVERLLHQRYLIQKQSATQTQMELKACEWIQDWSLLDKFKFLTIWFGFWISLGYTDSKKTAPEGWVNLFIASTEASNRRNWNHRLPSLRAATRWIRQKLKSLFYNLLSTFFLFRLKQRNCFGWFIESWNFPFFPSNRAF